MTHLIMIGCFACASASTPLMRATRPTASRKPATSYYVLGKRIDVVRGDEVNRCERSGGSQPELAPAIIEYLRRATWLPEAYRPALRRVVFFDYDGPAGSEPGWVFGARRPTLGLDLRSTRGVLVFTFPHGADIYCVTVAQDAELTVTIAGYERMRAD